MGSRRTRLIFVLLAALVFKGVYYFQSRQSPFFQPLLLDAKYYHDWALRILRGDVGGVFYGLPLYPFFMAAVYKLFGVSVMAVKWIQILFGAVTLYFIYRTGEKLFDAQTAFWGMFLAAFYGPIVFHEGIFIPEALGIPLYAGSFFACCELIERPSARLALLTGVCMGLAALTKAGIILFVFLYLAYFLWESRSPQKRKIVFLCLAAFFLTLAPVTAHNWVRGKDFVPLTSHAGFNFYVGNHPGAEGVFSAPEGTGGNVEAQIEDSRQIAESALGRPLKPSEVSKYWSKKAWDYIRSNPGDFFKLCLRKLALFFDSREISDVEDYRFAANYAGILRLPWPDFAWLGPLLFSGLALGFRRMRHRTIFALWVGAYLLGMMFFFVNARYRLPLLPVFFPVAAFGVIIFISSFKERRWKEIIFGFSAFAAGTVLGQLHLVGTDFSRDFVNAADAYVEMNQLPTSLKYYEQALKIDPQYAKANLGMALTLTKLRRDEEAKGYYEKTLSLDPRNSQAWNNLGLWYDRKGDLETAERHFLKALELKPNSAQAHNNLGMVYGKRGDAEKAVREFEKSLALNPAGARAHSNLALMVYKQGDTARARALWEKALVLDPDYQEARKALDLLDRKIA
jgi:4-amino-4-deoxy-L-arabinose transferase-like glycosyltransferase